jgi:hypothetical protein
MQMTINYPASVIARDLLARNLRKARKLTEQCNFEREWEVTIGTAIDAIIDIVNNYDALKKSDDEK